MTIVNTHQYHNNYTLTNTENAKVDGTMFLGRRRPSQSGTHDVFDRIITQVRLYRAVAIEISGHSIVAPLSAASGL